MGFERGRYYTRSRKVNGSVVREYVGCGEVAHHVHKLDVLKRIEREAQRQRVDKFVKTTDKEEELIDRYCEGIDALFQEAMQALGYRQHKKGEWRKQRGS